MILCCNSQGPDGTSRKIKTDRVEFVEFHPFFKWGAAEYDLAIIGLNSIIQRWAENIILKPQKQEICKILIWILQEPADVSNLLAQVYRS